jgi:hypothetical protein
MGQSSGEKQNGWCHHVPVKTHESPGPEDMASAMLFFLEVHIAPGSEGCIPPDDVLTPAVHLQTCLDGNNDQMIQVIIP